MSLDHFIRMADRLVEFEAALNTNAIPISSVFAIETHKEEVKSIWNKLKQAYDKCLEDISNDDVDGEGLAKDDASEEEEANELAIVKAKYQSCYITYSRCTTTLCELKQEMLPSPQGRVSSPKPAFSLPPCDIPTFQGDYQSWPTFRDLFTAVCKDNSRLSGVEKLFHLLQKTKGEAHDIVAKSPLTNEGFCSAWANLCSRFENRRILVNEQLKSLFNLPSISVESASSIKVLQRDINSCISALGLYEINVESWDPVFVFICSNRLPETTLTMWEQSLHNKAVIPKWSDLDLFLTDRHRTLESVHHTRSMKETKSGTGKSNVSSKKVEAVRTYHANVNPTECRLCPNEFHIIRKCPRFLEMDCNQRLSEIKASKLCINCFSSVHSVRNCKSKHSCFKCQRRHNTLLHRDTNDTTTASSPVSNSAQNTQPSLNLNTATACPLSPPIQSTTSKGSCVQTYFSIGSRTVLLGTALVRIDHLGDTYIARALLDSGSEGTLVSERLFKRLRIPFKRACAKISGLNNSVTADVSKQCSFALKSNMDDSHEVSATALVVPHLSSTLPSQTINIDSLPDLPQISLADPHFYRSSNVDVLIGSDLLPSIILPGVLQQVCGTLMAQQTIFGWVLTGPLPVSGYSRISPCVSCFCEISLDKEISRFWEVEDVPRLRPLSPQDLFCEELYRRTTRRNAQGRYIVSLPFKEDDLMSLGIGQSRQGAIAQFLRNECRLGRDTGLKRQYDEVLQEYIDLGHMSPVSAPIREDPLRHYYMPHHAVIKAESTTTKLRVVFNASCPTSNGRSLNDLLHTGPTLQKDLTVLILKWRLFRYVFSGDIQKMYRQILLNPEHTTFQRIVFRSNSKDVLQDFRLNTVTFGVNCAPYLAIRTILQLADDVQDKYPLASNILRSSMYVDDAIAGSHTIEDAISARDQLIVALKSAGFTMRKWTANTKKLLSDLPNDHLLFEDFLDLDDRCSAKTLGIRWNARSDEFYFSLTEFPENCEYTKREVLSQISKLFDPAGWLSPVVIQAKIIMQRVWVDRTEWDEVLSPASLQSWKIFQQNYSDINLIKIPRWIRFCPRSNVQFHAFSDASERAYAAVLYARVQQGESVSCHLISSKTRVAPIKTLSIPRLELCGATLLADMVDNVLPQLEIENYALFCWTDSSIVLSWLAKPPCFWTTFVANRISRISQVTDTVRWYHVNSEENPADLPSRGVSPQDLRGNDLWWHGPKWLSNPILKCPDFRNTETELERKPLKVNISYFVNFSDILERFSSFPRALRVVAYIYRFFHHTHPKFRVGFCRESTVISASEINSVKNVLIIVCQKAWYSREYHALSRKTQICSSSSLLSLNPFLDAKGVMRICGRLESAPGLSYDERHPIILPYDCQFSRLLVQFVHHISLHGGNQLVLRLLRTSYWIPRVQSLIRTTIHKCKPCVLYRKKCQKQLMAALPPERCEVSRPFTHTGLDFAGPFDIKTYSGRSFRLTKAYVCVFICFGTKAIHLEVTSDLSTSAFLAAFARFVSRRGCPLHIHSDNGTTFVGASRSIARDFLQASRESTISNYSHQNLVWHFIPPGAPHMGGLWEAGVKSFKQHFKKVAGNMKYTYEEFQTILCRIESCLNSRPLSPMSQDVSDLSALTPGHFLVGSPLLAPVEPSIDEAPLSLRNRWQRVKLIYQNFCSRWKSEYLKELHRRTKWKEPEENIHENALVVIKEDNIPPNCWRLGRICKVYPGSDKRIRVADIRTIKGTITRPITKLVVLPSDS